MLVEVLVVVCFEERESLWVNVMASTGVGVVLAYQSF
jgi:hypothetical protein